MTDGTVPFRYHKFDGDMREVETEVIEEGMITLRESGLYKIKAGVTTVEEVVRETVL